MQKQKTDSRRLITQWGERIENAKEKDSVLSEYPRPFMVREGWQSLNGLWKYAFCSKAEQKEEDSKGRTLKFQTGKKKKTETERTEKDDMMFPKHFDGEILVPFSPETRLSGVERQLKPESVLFYEREVFFSPQIRERYREGYRILLHFGAVDQRCEIFVNGKNAGSHSGGYLPFTRDITGFLKKEQALKESGFKLGLMVRDDSDTSYHSVGKQTLQPGGMYYQATSGIWQAVWLEAVPQVYIRDIVWDTFYDEGAVSVQAEMNPNMQGRGNAYEIALTFLNGEYSTERFAATEKKRFMLPGFQSWSPENPYLYRVRLDLYEKGKEAACDSVESYFAMRKCSIGTDEKGIRRIFLNNRPYMQAGLLDQGYWPESMYTPPSEEAMLFDIEKMKALGFNMLRKHVKVEPQRWYYHCDRLGMLVWQDMINGGRKNKGWYVTYLATLFQLLHIKATDRHKFLLSRQDAAGRKEYEQELAELARQMKKHPSVVCMVPFNEGWGQFATEKMTKLVQTINSGIIVDSASGWFDMGCGDLKSLHWYFFKLKYKKEKKRALALTEFGGYVQKIEGHVSHEKEYGYRIFHTKEELEAGYEELMRDAVLPAVKGGVSATVYTQLSDVEEEINGLFTYDRAVLKLEPALIKKWNQKLKNVLQESSLP